MSSKTDLDEGDASNQGLQQKGFDPDHDRLIKNRFGNVAPEWAPSWVVPIGVVMSIFVITILVFVTVVSLFRMGSKVVGNIELRFRSKNQSTRSSASSASYSKLESEVNSDC